MTLPCGYCNTVIHWSVAVSLTTIERHEMLRSDSLKLLLVDRAISLLKPTSPHIIFFYIAFDSETHVWF